MQKLTKKQKEVVQKMRSDFRLHWMGWINPRCFLSSKDYSARNVSVRIDTVINMRNAGLIEGDDRNLNFQYKLSDLGKTIDLT